MNPTPTPPRSSAASLRGAIDAAWRSPEPDCVPPLIAAARLDPSVRVQVDALARRLVGALRERRSRAGGVDALMKEFSLSSHEGVALMCLAEALLRVPDTATADRLIRDKLVGADWQAHLGHSPSLFVNATSWALLLTGRLLAPSAASGLGATVGRLVERGGESLIRKGMDLAMRMLGEQFVTGRNIAEALERTRERATRGYRHSFDMLGEAALTAADARRYRADYAEAIHAIGAASAGRGVIDGDGISIKLSALHPRYGWSQRDRVLAELLPELAALCQLARRYDIGLNIDAEESDRLDLSLDLLEALALDPALAGWDGLGFVVQAYQKRAPFVIDWLIDLARRSGRRLMVRLVKGAYWDAEIKRAQVDGLVGYPVYTRKVYTDVAYLACARKLLAAQDLLYPQFATHNAHTLAALFHLAGPDWQPGDYEFQCLHGMGEALYDQLVGQPGLHRQVRIYAPVGSHRTLLAYLVRRLLENGANTSFVNRIVDANVAIDSLVADPADVATPLDGAPHPRIPLPTHLYGTGRRNAAGFDLACGAVQARLTRAIAASRHTRFSAAPCPAGHGPAQVVTNPADRSEQVGEVIDASPDDIDRACAAASASPWPGLHALQRAAILERAADAFEAEADTLIALAVREAGKTWANAVGELREAVDFLRYYAAQARDLDPVRDPALGPLACISPWNFPLAIFTGQLAAALAAGNPVLAKPAEQTPLIAACAVALLHAAGVPADALQLLPGPGETVGAALVADPRIRGVLFTGSTEVARLIQRQLARRGGNLPLIAETGGQNAMIVDATALPEQVVGDVLASAFDSAGQRCSALRVLCLQDDIAAPTLAMLRGALDELRVGDPADPRTDIGPVIDADARARLDAYVDAQRARGAPVTRLTLPPACAAGTFVAPTLIEIADLRELAGEQFGPVLHVLRFPADGLAALLDGIAASGYGLTLGVHSRIDATVETVRRRARVGNLYVNRSMVGAVVGVQPFGGEGLSGTGPKAGGPLYLQRLVRHGASPRLANGALRVEAVGSGEDAPFAALRDWLDGGARLLFDADTLVRLRERADICRAHRLAGIRLTLPGPTGEDNRLYFVPRGCVAGCVDGPDDAPARHLHQLIAAIANGNGLRCAPSAPARRLREGLPALVAACFVLDADWFDTDFGALLHDGDDASADAWLRRLGERPGPIVPLLRPTPDYDPARLILERCVTINTAAAGGNASLMTLEA
ncbi:bifunctional proline dehydrogenase/L-glutamate gamma-semialdehyde dehydrogenase PutA [Zoogloea sp.]|uniref:bifunctional proline dehydrogenase/L-glutamate gamma-semialdehyde dehydrogenase PutA n=1 Tax=Zoogloea sp. TaxID=49181 RepID=UPI0035AE43FA